MKIEDITASFNKPHNALTAIADAAMEAVDPLPANMNILVIVELLNEDGTTHAGMCSTQAHPGDILDVLMRAFLAIGDTRTILALLEKRMNN